ncbi:hypothetical protein HED60_12045 [Planctomycetales bacterium ZRK34]|nr:hypothetical protein HED60_12045 [Planctomycetales bacterium ZRK34]
MNGCFLREWTTRVLCLVLVVGSLASMSAAADLAVLSTGQPNIVSSEWIGKPEFNRANLNDGNFGTLWSAAEKSTDAWVQIDLGAEVTVAAAVLDEGKHKRSEQFVIQAQVGDQWQTLASGTTIGKNKRVNFEPVKARLFRVVVVECSGPPVLAEFRLLGPTDHVPAWLNRRPLHPKQNPDWQAHVNRQRFYDFYTKQAMRYGPMNTDQVLPLIPQYPGLDGGVTHWGNQNEDSWRDNRPSRMNFGSMVGGVFHGAGKKIGRAYAVQLSDELNAVFNLDTLKFEVGWRGKPVSWSDVRVGMLHGTMMGDQPVVEVQAPGDSLNGARYIGLHRRGDRVAFEYEQNGKRRFRFAEAHDGKVMVRDVDTLDAAIGKATGPQWPQRVITTGTMGEGSPYAIDTLTLPYDNPWNALMFLGGVDCVSPTRLAVCTLHGDVWVVDVSDQNLSKLRWKRYAAGLHHALGLKVVDGVIYVIGRDQLVALHDTDGDDEADFYECITMAHKTSAAGHQFVTGLERDDQGRWYFVSGNQGYCRISADGRKADVVATGFRNPDGIGISPDGSVLLTSLQEGNWTPASAVCDASWGGYFGYGGPKGDPPGYKLPMLYLPRGEDNSSGGQTYIDSDRWGPVRGQWLHQSFGAAKHFLVLREVVGEQSQAMAIPLPGEFLSGAHRARFSPYDGQLYVVGCQGWGSYSTQDGSLQRVRYTGGDYPYPIDYQTRNNGIMLTFATPRSADYSDAKRWFAQQWNYRYASNYGSAEYSATMPDQPGHDPVEIRSIQRLDDGKRLFIEIPQLQPIQQLHLNFNGADGFDLYGTIHRLGEPFTDFPGYEKIKKFNLVVAMSDPQQVTVDTCKACHHPTQQIIGPPLSELRKLYADNPEGIVQQAMDPQKKNPNLPPMPPFDFMGKDKLREIADQILAGAE